MTLHDYMAQADDKKIYSIEAQTSYFFIGNVVDYVRTIKQISEQYRKSFERKKKDYTPLYDREVVNVYPKLLDPMEVTIVIQGEETGHFWFKEEFDKVWGEEQ